MGTSQAGQSIRRRYLFPEQRGFLDSCRRVENLWRGNVHRRSQRGRKARHCERGMVAGEPQRPAADPWPEHWFYKGWPDRAGVAVADLNRDGRLDIALAAAESRGRLSWFEGPADPIRGSWKEHVINEHVDFVHTSTTTASQTWCLPRCSSPTRREWASF